MINSSGDANNRTVSGADICSSRNYEDLNNYRNVNMIIAKMAANKAAPGHMNSSRKAQKGALKSERSSS